MSVTQEPTVWYNGRIVENVDHIAASGEAPPQESPELAQEWQAFRLNDMYSGVIDHVTVGISERIHQGIHQVKAWAWAETDYPHLLETDVFTLREDADVKSIRAIDPYNRHDAVPVRHLTREYAAEQSERVGRARESMTKQERSPLDMVALARELAAEAKLRMAIWSQQLTALAEERRLDEEAKAAYLLWERGKKVIERERRQEAKASKQTSSVSRFVDSSVSSPPFSSGAAQAGAGEPQLEEEQ